MGNIWNGSVQVFRALDFRESATRVESNLIEMISCQFFILLDVALAPSLKHRNSEEHSASGDIPSISGEIQIDGRLHNDFAGLHVFGDNMRLNNRFDAIVKVKTRYCNKFTFIYADKRVRRSYPDCGILTRKNKIFRGIYLESPLRRNLVSRIFFKNDSRFLVAGNRILNSMPDTRAVIRDAVANRAVISNVEDDRVLRDSDTRCIG